MLLLICIIVGIIIAENHFHKFYPNNYVLSQLLLYRHCYYTQLLYAISFVITFVQRFCNKKQSTRRDDPRIC